MYVCNKCIVLNVSTVGLDTKYNVGLKYFHCYCRYLASDPFWRAVKCKIDFWLCQGPNCVF